LNEDSTFTAVESAGWTKASNLFVPEPSSLPSFFVDDTLHKSRISTGYTGECHQHKGNSRIVNVEDPSWLGRQVNLVWHRKVSNQYTNLERIKQRRRTHRAQYNIIPALTRPKSPSTTKK
jgi:hypothetical protein